MKPPICAVCFRDFRSSISEGGLVRFKLTQANIEHNKRFEKPGFVGHKAGQEWFCKNHYEAAKKLQHLTFSEAVKAIKTLK